MSNRGTYDAIGDYGGVPGPFAEAGADHFVVMGNRPEGGTGTVNNLAGTGATKICKDNL